MKETLITLYSAFTIFLISWVEKLLHFVPGAITLTIQWTIGILTIIYLIKQIKSHGRDKKTT